MSIKGFHSDGEVCYHQRCALDHSPPNADSWGGGELLTPQEWCDRRNIRIKSPDGWRGRFRRYVYRQLHFVHPKGLDVPITEEEFEFRVSLSTLLHAAMDDQPPPAPPNPAFDKLMENLAERGTVLRYADAAMYRREAMPEETRATGGGRRPRVTLINATTDPLGSLAQLVGIYRGKVYRSLAEVTDDDRRAALDDMMKTELNGPLEAIQFQFLVEGVSRSFTHQAVRTRAAFFAQESLRFAVADGESWVDNSAYPPSLAQEPVSVEEIIRRVNAADDPAREGGFLNPQERDYAVKRDAWDDAIITAQQAYQRLIDAGVPAEDARGLMPHAITTRYVWVVSLRTLLVDAGKRLCTQAQFEWRLMMADLVRALRTWEHEPGGPNGEWTPTSADAWQFQAIADLLRPVCYQAGRCTFMSSFDRGCRIRERVERFAANGVPSTNWDTTGQYDVAAGPSYGGGVADGPDFKPLIPIKPEEWLTDPDAARWER